ncbi:MAG: family 43 glycosylhydrolase [Prevotellaceae bacterium]|jgi:arabinan endo-1,5-alpha-L-arabinosidase|nr:family 43 glycosylhydrolase [Prevotellaceae bacterium]
MKHPPLVLLIIAAAVVAPCGSAATSATAPQDEPSAGVYRNPVVRYSLPDPSVMLAADGYFYLYATEDIRNMPIHRSKNLVDWEFVGTAFTDSTRPTFEPKGGLWAPDINYIDGRYVLYYAMSRWGCLGLCGIGVAVADAPEGPFTDRGALFVSNEIGVDNSIDAFYMEDDGGTPYLFWGSFYGIYAIALAADGLSLREGAEKQAVAGSIYEGVYIHKKNGYYYMLASTGTCCEGLTSTYTTVVGRSEHLFGPYVDRQGRPMLENYHETLLRGNDRFVGTGHNSEIVQDAAGHDWILYHAFDTTHEKGRRMLMLDRVVWRDGWPAINDGSPSIEAPAPLF